MHVRPLDAEMDDPERACLGDVQLALQYRERRLAKRLVQIALAQAADVLGDPQHDVNREPRLQDRPLLVCRASARFAWAADPLLLGFAAARFSLARALSRDAASWPEQRLLHVTF